MRELTSHKVNPCNEQLRVLALDEPGDGGASHLYRLEIDPHQSVVGEGETAETREHPPRSWNLDFQNGPIQLVGVNGITHEALIAIVIDRLEAFQGGPFANDYNMHAIEHLKGAAAALKARTEEREARGVEGTHEL